MNDGYYLSTYIEIGKLQNIYNYSQRHDFNISLWEKKGQRVELLHYWELERRSGRKEHQLSFFDQEQAKATINSLLKEEGLSLADMQAVLGTPAVATCGDYHSLNAYPEYAYHGIAHLFSALLIDTEKFYGGNILACAVDGGPDTIVDTSGFHKFFYPGAYSVNGNIRLFPCASPGILWRQARERFKLKEGSLMALGSASQSRLLIEPENELVLYKGNLQDLSFNTINTFLDRLFSRVDSLSEADEGKVFNYFDPNFSPAENRISMIVKEIQKMSLRIMEWNLETAIQTFRIEPEKTYLALSGGFVLNCPTNTHLMHKYGFREFLAPPCVNDSGLSMGMALYYFYSKMDSLQFQLRDGYYGDYSGGEWSEINADFAQYIADISNFDTEQAVRDIQQEPIVWFNGRAEIGPRALGNRSILADAGSDHSKDRLNKIKLRQWWRPVAPVILEECLEDWFEDPFPSRFMLNTFKIRKSCISRVPAVAHLDRTARIQSIGKSSTNPMLYQLLQAFYKTTGIPMLCNTSLNDRGEPIINRIDQVVNFCLRKDIKVAYIDGRRVEFKNHADFPMTDPMPRTLNIGQNGEAKELRKRYNPHNLPPEILHFYFNMYNLFPHLDLRKEEDTQQLIRIAETVFQTLGVKYIPFL